MDTKQEWLDELEGLKKDLEKSFTAQMKASIEADITKLETKLKAEENNDLKDIKAWQVTKDEADQKNQKALDDLLKKQTDQIIAAQGNQVKSFDQLLKEGFEENVDGFQKFARKETNKFSFQLKTVADMGFAGHFGSASQSTSMVRPGIIENPKRKVHVRDLVPQGTMDGSTFYYVKENGDGEGAIATAAENATKAQVDLDLVEASANAEYIAGWLRISKKMLADVKGMTSFLQSRLMDKLLRAEDAQLLLGNGNTPNISGIQDAGNFTEATNPGLVDIEQLVNGISQLEDEEERTADGILIRPAQLYAIALNKAAGSGEYDLPSIVTVGPNGQLRILGVPVYASTAMQADKYIVGDWSMGAMLLTREPAVIEFFYEDGTNVRENKVTVRVEERVAFPIFGDNYFIRGDFGNAAS